MFNLTGSEIVIILLLALVVLGPDKLPEAMRKAGKTWGELRKMTSTFQDEVRKGFDEPTQEIRQTASAVKKAATINTNPVKGAVKSLLDPPASSKTKAAVAAPASAAAGAATVDVEVVEATGVDPSAVETPVETPVADDAVADETVADDTGADDATRADEAGADDAGADDATTLVDAAPDAKPADPVAEPPVESDPTAEPADPDTPVP